MCQGSPRPTDFPPIIVSLIPGQDLVSKPARQDQAAPGVGAGEDQDHLDAAAGPPIRDPALAPAPGPRIRLPWHSDIATLTRRHVNINPPTEEQSINC